MTGDAMNGAKRQAWLAKRYRAEVRFKAYGLAAIGAAAVIVVTLLGSILYTSLPAFTHHSVQLDVELPLEKFEEEVNYVGLVRGALQARFPQVTTRADRRALNRILSIGASDVLRGFVAAHPHKIGQVVSVALPLSDDIDLVMKGLIDRDLPESDRIVSDRELAWLDSFLAGFLFG